MQNLLKIAMKRGYETIVIGIEKESHSSTEGGIRFIPLVNIQNYRLERIIPLWLFFLIKLYISIVFLDLPKDAIVISHRMDCLLAFVIFKNKNPKFLISAAPGYYLRTKYPVFYRYFGWLYQLVETICIKNTKCIFPTDFRTKSYYLKKYPKANITEPIPSPIDLELFRPIPRHLAKEKVGLPLHNQILLFVGRMVEVKNLPILLDAFRKIEKFSDRIILVLIGHGEDYFKIKELADRTCRNTLFLGAISPDQMPYYYSAANALVLCSKEEGSPTVVKEALACGIPVISTDVGDVNRIISSPILGKIVENDSDSLKEGILSVLTFDENIEQSNFRRKSVEKYNVEIIGETLFEKINKSLLALE